MTYEAILLIFGILLLLVGLVGKVKAKELEIGTSSAVARAVIGVIGIALIVVSLVIVQPSFFKTSEKPKPAEDKPDVVHAQALNGIYIIRQLSSSRFVDAYENEKNDFRLVTRGFQNNNTQRWRFSQINGNVYTIQQVSTNRYVDAHETKRQDYRLVTRSKQDNDTQRWIVTSLGNDVYTIQQKSNHRYVDAHETSSQDYRLVTRPRQDNDTQRWLILPDEN